MKATKFMSADFFDPVLAEDLTWTGSRLSFLEQIVKPFFGGSHEKWILGIGRAKMGTNGGPRMRLQKAHKL